MVRPQQTRAGRSRRPQPGTTAHRIWAMLDFQRGQLGDIETAEIYSMCEPLEIPRETVKSCIFRYKKHHRMI